MFNKKLFISIFIFSIFMIFTSIIKNKTRIIEKNIYSYEKKIVNLKNNLYEAQLDFSYLSSPENLSKNIFEYSNEEYSILSRSRIYQSLDEFLKESKKTTMKSINENKKK
tara:strand:+ start:362 stop:691 length:330 start_codon:yes stop_codon:yes gene_type:complete